MTEKQKLELLKKVFSQHGLDFNDEQINDFFTETRKRSETLTKLDESTKEELNYGYSELVRPLVKKVTPMDIENSSYADTYDIKSILDWFLYGRSKDEKLVLENLETEQFDVFSSYVKENQVCPLNEDLEGVIFNGEEGNSELLSLIIRQFIEYSKAKTDLDRESVIDKYSMDALVNLPHREELCAALRDRYAHIIDSYYYGGQSVYPRLACSYRIDSFPYPAEEEYIVEYDPETGKYTYEFNLEKFIGTDEELIGYLAVNEVSAEPIMKWCAGGMYYLSCNNQVWKSSSKEEIEKLVPQIQKWHKEGKSQLNNYLEVKDIDSQTYEFEYPDEYVNDEATSKAYSDFWGLVLRGRPEKTLYKKLKDVDYVKRILQESLKQTARFSLPDFKYKNLTKDEFSNIKTLFEQFEKFKQNINNVEV